MTHVRGRFAPTPSGELHIGNALTALLAWLQVRRLNGSFILRIEDLDIHRLREGVTEALLHDLRWLGLDWDEGPDVSGPHAPYRQKDRTHLYKAAFAKLQSQKRVYPCFCSRAERLQAAAAPHGLASEGPIYDGRCRGLSEADCAELARSKTPAWRFIVPSEPVSFNDLSRGRQTFPPGAGGDCIIRRADDIYAYQLAVVVDDAEIGITHVLRGDDLLDSTPRQLYLYDALGLTPPLFAHVPLICDEAGRRLAKRDKDLTIASLRNRGISPQQLIGWLAAIAGMIPRPEAVGVRDLVPHFDAAKLPRSPIRLTPQMLRAIML